MMFKNSNCVVSCRRDSKKKDEAASAGDAVAGKKTCPISAFSGRSGDDGAYATAK
jgi:hypothetical protein